MKTKLNLTHSLIFVISFLGTMLNISNFAAAATDEGRVKVRDYPFYREFLYKDSHITIAKKSKFADVVFSKPQSSVHLISSKKKSIYNFTIPTKNFTNFIIYKKLSSEKAKIGFISKKKQTYFSTPGESFSCSTGYKDALNSLTVSKLSEKIQDFQISNLLDSASCSKIEKTKKDDYEEALISGFNPKASSLVSCLSSKKMQDLLDQDLILKNTATAIFANYLVLLTKITNSESPIKFKCKMPAAFAQKSGCYDENENTVSFNPDKAKDPQALNELFNHEIIHVVSPELPSINQKYLLDEAVVNKFTCLCAQTVGNSQLAAAKTNCDEQQKGLAVAIAGGDGGLSFTAANDALEATQQAAQEKKKDELISSNLPTTVPPATFVPVSKSTFDEMANTALVATNGKAISESDEGIVREIIPSPELKQGIDEVYSKLSTATSGVTQALVKATIAPAQAATTPTRSIASATPSTTTPELTTYPRAEMYADKYATDFDAQTAGITNPLASKNSTGAVQDSLSAANNAKTTNTSASGFASGPGTRAASKTTQADSSLTVATAEDPTQSAKPTRGPASIDESATQNSYQPTDNVVMQSLSGLNRVSGSTYQEIKNLYNDQNFIKQLQQRNLSITRPDGKTIGSTSKAAIQFLDNGQNLVKIIKKGI